MWIALSIVAVLVITVVGYLAFLPGRFEVRRNLELSVPVETAFAAVVDLKSWPFWSPWLLHEPDARLDFSEDYRSEEGFYEWDGKLIGAGRLTHASIVPNHRIEQELEIIRPYKSVNRVDWTFENRDNGCLVSWEMEGRMPFLFRFMVKSTVPMIERDYDLGLAMLHGYVNGDAPHPTLHFVGEETLDDFNYWAIPFNGKLRQLESIRQQQIDALESASDGHSGVPLTLLYQFEANTIDFNAEIAIPVANSAPLSNYTPREFHGGRYFKLSIHGDHRFLPLGWHALFSHFRMRRIKHDKTRPALEIYQDDPSRAENSNEVMTALYLPIR